VSGEGERVQKVLANAGVASRRAVEELISAGRVSINGVPARLGQRIDPSKDEVEVDGSRVPLRADLVYYLINKPRGVVATADDPQGRPTVLELLDAPARVWPVGRLDVDTEGALIVTNDGDLTHRLTHPSFGVPKTYLARVKGHIGSSALKSLAKGVALDDGPTAPARVHLVGKTGGSSLVEIVISEGRNRQVRRMFDAVGHPVIELARTAIGSLEIGRLRPGTLRRLSPVEVQGLYAAVPSDESS
jgi:23S rRNA pseudouridine2605 synthase